MLRAVAAQLVHRPARALALLVGIVVASVGFALLSSAVRTSQVRVTGTVRAHFGTSAYDVLVRPRGSRTALEMQRGLVPAEFGTGIYGGITAAQYQVIRSLPAVKVAAPVENLGYFLPSINVPVLLGKVINGDPVQIYRIHASVTAQNGLSTYPAGDSYVYYTSNYTFVRENGGVLYQVGAGGLQPVCGGFYKRPTPFPVNPLDMSHGDYMACFSARSPAASDTSIGDSHVVGAEFTWQFPVLLTAVDPVQEAKLVGLNKTIVTGRYLRAGQPPVLGREGGQAAR